MAFELIFERVWSVEGEWEGVFRKWTFAQKQPFWEVAEDPRAAGPYSTWRMVKVEDGNTDPRGSHFI